MTDTRESISAIVQTIVDCLPTSDPALLKEYVQVLATQLVVTKQHNDTLRLQMHEMLHEQMAKRFDN
jgi:hypothetical protein